MEPYDSSIGVGDVSARIVIRAGTPNSYTTETDTQKSRKLHIQPGNHCKQFLKNLSANIY